jgi:hypothetical protein
MCRITPIPDFSCKIGIPGSQSRASGWVSSLRLADSSHDVSVSEVWGTWNRSQFDQPVPSDRDEWPLTYDRVGKGFSACPAAATEGVAA